MNNHQEDKDEKRWKALSSGAMKRKRDDVRALLARQDRSGSEVTFIYAVRTTGVYCLPGCSSRLPKRENVEFFDNCGEARKAGFRACKRCEPDRQAAAMTELVERACRIIEERNGQVKLSELAQAVGISSFHLLRQFKRQVGMTPKKYAAGKQRDRLQSALKEGSTVTQAINEAGYESPSRVYSRDMNLGLSPKHYRSGGKGASIQYGIQKCNLGFVLVATTPKGICCIELGDSSEAVANALRKRFPHAAIVEGDESLNEQISVVVSIVENPSKEASSLPLDIQGTAFQLQVWHELRKIPAGSTTTYSEIARRMNKPQAVRAVASAVASNKIAVIIPCHRVVGKGGELSGYHWGVDRKRRLLKSEQADREE